MKGNPFFVSVATVITLANVIAIATLTRHAITAEGGFWSTPAAAWVQAIGIIDAMFVAALAPTWQRWSEQQDERKRRNIAATAFSINLVPQLQIIADDLEQAFDAVGSALEDSPSGEIDVNYVEFKPTGPAVEFIHANWQIIAGFNEETVRAIVSGIEILRLSRRLPSWEEGFSVSFDNGNFQDSRRLVFDDAERARQYALTIDLARERINKAIDEIEIARSGEPRTVIVIEEQT